MTLKNLTPGQYQIGNLIFGKGTTVPVETFDIKPYDVNTQDYQVSRSDERRFGWDQHVPATIEITFHVLKNWLLPPYEGTIPNFWAKMPTVQQFQQEWKSNDIRNVWGQMKPLYYCANDGVTRAIFGRPGQFTYGKDTPYTESVQCLGEFRRADTMTYAAKESFVELSSDAAPSFLTRQVGDADSWLRIIGVGPLTNPVITVGEQQIQLNTTVAEGESFEISSYPWQRRAVNSQRVNLASAITGTAYLDKVKLPAGMRTPVRWTSDEFKTFIPALGNRSWVEDLDTNWFILPAHFNIIHGMPVVWWDWLNTIEGIFLLQLRFRAYIGPSPFGGTSAVIYNAQTYNTASQYCEASVVPNTELGRSGLVIMANTTMTDGFVFLEVQHGGLLGNYLRIYSGTTYNNLTQRDEWQYVGTWFDEDRVAIGFDPATKTYTGYHNGTARVSWQDSGVIVPTDATHRSAGFIFDVNDTWITAGPGFANIVCYDTAAQVPGQIFLLWRDAWSTVV